jgi:hypothetical protein
MELTRITKLLLWLLSKRPDIGAVGIHEATQTELLQDPEFTDFTYDELYGEYDTALELQCTRDHLEDCLGIESNDPKGS